MSTITGEHHQARAVSVPRRVIAAVVAIALHVLVAAAAIAAGVVIHAAMVDSADACVTAEE